MSCWCGATDCPSCGPSQAPAGRMDWLPGWGRVWVPDEIDEDDMAAALAMDGPEMMPLMVD